jgi:hypothetical protein
MKGKESGSILGEVSAVRRRLEPSGLNDALYGRVIAMIVQIARRGIVPLARRGIVPLDRTPRARTTLRAKTSPHNPLHEQRHPEEGVSTTRA